MDFKRFLTVTSAAALIGAASPAMADDHTGVYMGAGAGIYYLEFDNTDFDESAGNVRVFGGYRLNDYLAFELGYSQLLEASGDVLGVDVDVDGNAFDLSVRPTVVLSDEVELYGVVGWAEYDFDISASGFGVSASGEGSDGDLFYGLGGALSLGDQLQVRGEWTTVDVSDGDYGTVSVSAIYRF